RRDDGTAADLAGGQPTGAEMFSLDDAVHARDQRIAARHGENGGVIADALRARAEAAKGRANRVELVSLTQGSHSADGRVERNSGSSASTGCRAGRVSKLQLARSSRMTSSNERPRTTSSPNALARSAARPWTHAAAAPARRGSPICASNVPAIPLR